MLASCAVAEVMISRSPTKPATGALDAEISSGAETLAAKHHAFEAVFA